LANNLSFCDWNFELNSVLTSSCFTELSDWLVGAVSEVGLFYDMIEI